MGASSSFGTSPGSPCVECWSPETHLEGTDEGFVKICDECGHVGGPYVSNYNSDRGEEEQLTLDDY